MILHSHEETCFVISLLMQDNTIESSQILSGRSLLVSQAQVFLITYQLLLLTPKDLLGSFYMQSMCSATEFLFQIPPLQMHCLFKKQLQPLKDITLCQIPESLVTLTIGSFSVIKAEHTHSATIPLFIYSRIPQIMPQKCNNQGLVVCLFFGLFFYKLKPIISVGYFNNVIVWSQLILPYLPSFFDAYALCFIKPF